MKIVFLIAFLVSSFAFSRTIEAPINQIDFQQNPSHIQWLQINTDHFDIIFPKEMILSGQRVAHLLEKAYPYVTRSLETLPARIPVILQNQSTHSNGFVALAPRRSEWYVTPSIDPELTNTDWLKTLSVHEFRHIVQFQKSRQGFNKVLNILFGEIGQALGIGLSMPPWFLEGDAVGIETALTKGGRGRLPLFDRDLKALLLSGKNWNYDKAHLGSFKDYIPNHYVYGYFYTSWLRNKYGDFFVSKIADYSTDRSWNPLSFYNSVDYLTGEKFEKIYEDIMKEISGEWKKRVELLRPTPFVVQSVNQRGGWTNYLHPQSLGDGRIVSLKRGLSFINQFVMHEDGKERVLFYPGPLQNEYPYKVRSGKLAFVETEIDPRWGYRDFSRIRVYDVKKEEFVLDKRQTKGRLAIVSHDGEKLVYVEWTENQAQSLVVLDMKGREVLRVPMTSSEVITSLDWLSKDELILIVKDQNDMKEMVKFHLQSRKGQTLIKKTVSNLGSVAVEEGQILYESPESGIDNIWLYSANGVKQLTSSVFGSYSPSLNSGKLLYNDYTADGMDIVTKSVSWDQEEKSKDSFFPIYEKFAKNEKYESFENDLLKTEKFKLRKYSQPAHALNLHSWLILAPPLSSTVSLVGYSRDVLNKFSLSAGAIYNLNERTTEGFVGASWSHYYPVFDLRAGYGKRRQDFIVSGKEIENKWEEGTLEIGAQVPWKFIQGRFTHSFSGRAFSKFIKTTTKVSEDRGDLLNGTLLSPGAELSYSVSSRLAPRDINPGLAFEVNASAEEGQDISGSSQSGSLKHVDGKLFLPGLFAHHSFFHQLAYEKQNNKSYQYSSLVFYPRGTKSFFLQEFTKYSGNYLMPLFYPDWNMSRYLYFKRISLNLFYDELNGTFRSTSYHAASTGWEAIFDFNLARIFVPFSIGVRGSYVLDGLEKAQNYEVFLSSVMGTF